MDESYTGLDNSALFDHHAYGRQAEQHLAALSSPEPDDIDGLKHQAALLQIAHQGRQAQGEILRRHSAGEFNDPQHIHQAGLIQQQAQEEQDQAIHQGLATGQLMIPSPEDEQRLANNANARSKWRSSPYLTDEQKKDLEAQSFANDAEIRRAAMPVPPEEIARSPETRVQKMVARMPPDLRERLGPFVASTQDGDLQFMRGMPNGVLDSGEQDFPDPSLPDQMGDSALFDVPPEKVPDQASQPSASVPQQPPAGDGQKKADEEFYRFLQKNPSYLSPSLREWAKENGYLSALRWNGKEKHYEIDRPTLQAMKEHYTEQYKKEHPNGTSPEERQQAAEEKRRQFEEREHDKGTEYNRKQNDSRQKFLIKWEEEQTNAEPPEKTSSTLGFGGGDPNPAHDEWKKKRAAAEEKALKMYPDYVPRKPPQEQDQGKPEKAPDQSQPQGPPQKRPRSGSGKFEWDGAQWVPVGGS